MDDTRASWYCDGVQALFLVILVIVLIVVDVMIYYPFLKVYDEQILEEERGQ